MSATNSIDGIAALDPQTSFPRIRFVHTYENEWAYVSLEDGPGGEKMYVGFWPHLRFKSESEAVEYLMSNLKVGYVSPGEWALVSCGSTHDGEGEIWSDHFPDLRFETQEEAEKYLSSLPRYPGVESDEFSEGHIDGSIRREQPEKFIRERHSPFSKDDDEESEEKAGCGEHLKPARTYELRFLFRGILDRIGAWCYRMTTPPHPERVNLTEAEVNTIILGLESSLETYRSKLSNTGTVSVPWEIVETFVDFTDWSCYYCRHPTCKAGCEDCCITAEGRLRLMKALLGEGEVNQVK